MKDTAFCIVAILSALVLFPIGICRAMFQKGRRTYFRKIAVGIDQLGNVVMAPVFNPLFITPGGYQFGNVEETISSVVGKNFVQNTLTSTGFKFNKWLCRSLGPDHTINSIEQFIQ